MQAGTIHLIDRVGCFRPKIETLDALGSGEIGFITAQIKEVSQTAVGDTITAAKRLTAAPLPGFKEAQPVVFCGLFRSEDHTSELISLMRNSSTDFLSKHNIT